MLCINCKKNKYPLFNCNKLNYCNNHALLLFNSFVIKIQKVYRGYRRRKYLKNIFNRLPRDLQLHILQFNNNKTKLLHEKINAHILKMTSKIKSLIDVGDNEITLNELITIIDALIKYHHLIETRWLNYYKYYFINIKSILVSLIYKKALMLNINIFNSLNFYTNLLNNDFNKVSLVLIGKINSFNHATHFT
jgi:hypothetical protein